MKFNTEFTKSEFTKSFRGSDWAKAFVEAVKQDPEIATDEGAMVGWFANAIMRGYDAAKQQPSGEKVRVLRIVEIIGDREAVEEQVRASLHGERIVRNGRVTIRSATLGEFPEILERALWAEREQTAHWTGMPHEPEGANGETPAEMEAIREGLAAQGEKAAMRPAEPWGGHE